MVRLSRLLLVAAFLFGASGAFAQTIQGPLQAQNSLSEIASNGTQSTAQTNLFGYTISLGGNVSTGGAFTLSGAYSATFTLTGTTTVTFPTAGTLLTTTGNGSGLTGLTYSQLPALSANQLLGSLTATTPSGQSVPSCSTSSSALDWTSGTGFSCNTAVNAAQLTGNTWAVPGTIGSTTANTGAFTTLSASSTVSGSGFSTYLASPPAIGGTAAAAGSFTTLSASSTVSGAGFSTYLASPPAIGGTAAAAGSFTTLSASSTVSGSGFSTYLASPPAIGGTAAASGKFTTLTATSTVTGIGLIGVQVFTSGTSTYTPDTGTQAVIVEVQGSGAGSGGCAATGAGQVCVTGGSGAGSYGSGYITSAFSGVTVTVGAGGAAGAAGNNNGGSGNTSSFGTLISCPGGNPSGGAPINAVSSYNVYGSGGTQATACTFSGATSIANIPGQAGGVGSIWASTANGDLSGAGGNSVLGSGGVPIYTATTVPGNSGTGYGSGSSGCASIASQAASAGTAGKAGIVIVYEFN